MTQHVVGHLSSLLNRDGRGYIKGLSSLFQLELLECFLSALNGLESLLLIIIICDEEIDENPA